MKRLIIKLIVFCVCLSVGIWVVTVKRDDTLRASVVMGERAQVAAKPVSIPKISTGGRKVYHGNHRTTVSGNPILLDPKLSREKPVTILSSTPTETVFELTPAQFSVEQVSVNGVTCSKITHPDTDNIKWANAPSLPVFSSNIVIPSHSSPRVEIVDSSFIEIDCEPPAPSTGFTIRKKGVTPVADFGSVYQQNRPFPSQLVSVGKPYFIRNVCGVQVNMYPFQYLPGSRKLRVYQRIRFKVVTGEASTLQVVKRTSSRAFNGLIQAQFDNVETAEAATAIAKPAGLNEAGHLLLVVAEGLVDNVTDFVKWKRERGFQVSVKSWPAADIGTAGSAKLKNYISSVYRADSELTFVILVGDVENVPSGRMTVAGYTAEASDTLYALQAGDDLYHDLFLSRISATTSADLLTQLNRIIRYEKKPDLTDNEWYQKVMMVASNQGANLSSFKKNDWEILNEEWDKNSSTDDLLGYGFTAVTKLYDSNPMPPAKSDVVNAMNGGNGLVYYLGHGTEGAWSTSTFNSESVGLLTNSHAFPFVMNGNCQNGDFTWSGGDCLAEAMMKAGTPETPFGAVGVVSSTSDMHWDPPIVMMRYFNDLLISDANDTTGALTFLSVMYAMNWCNQTPRYGSFYAKTIMQQVHLFGDCTLGLRTKKPMKLAVVADSKLSAHQLFPVTVKSGGKPLANVEVCIYQSPTRQIMGRTDSMGRVKLKVGEIEIGAAKLTVYTRNSVPFQQALDVVAGDLRIHSAATLPVGSLHKNYAFSSTATGGDGVYRWSLLGAPSWLSISNEGKLSGTPSVAEQVSFTIRVTDGTDKVAEQLVSLNTGKQVAFQTSAFATTSVLTNYYTTVQAVGDYTPFSFALVEGTLPPGSTLSADGVISGVIKVAGDYRFKLKVSDSAGNDAIRGFNILVNATDKIWIDGTTLTDGERHKSYTHTLVATGGSGNGFSWRLKQGETLPKGLSLSSAGVVSGTPTEAGNSRFVVTVVDGASPVNSQDFTLSITINSPIYFVPETLPTATRGANYFYRLQPKGTYKPFVFKQATGTFISGQENSTFKETGTLKAWRTAGTTQDKEWSQALGFTFNYYGKSYTSCRIGDNGYLILGDEASPSLTYRPSKTALENHVMIAPFWSDLVITADYMDAGIWVDQGDGFLTVRWKGKEFHHLDKDWFLNFSVTLYNNGEIRFSYGTVTTTNSAVVGVSGGAGKDSVVSFQHSYDPKSPQAVEGFNERNDFVYASPAVVPSWLNLSTSGLVSGVVPSGATGKINFSVAGTDGRGNVDYSTFSFEVSTLATQVVVDTNKDGQVNSYELLNYLEQYHLGHVSESQVSEAISTWLSSSDTVTPPVRKEGAPMVTVGRTFSQNKYFNNYQNSVTLNLNFTGTIPRDFIEVEELPDGWSYIKGSTVAADKSVLADPKVVGQRLVWLFREQKVADWTFSYSVHANNSLEMVAFSGGFKTLTTAQPVVSDNRWSGRPMLQLQAGWNMQAVPGVLEPNSMAQLRAHTTAIWTWDGEKYIIPESIELGKGYWFYATESKAIPLELAPTQPTLSAIPLNKGWTIMGVNKGMVVPYRDFYYWNVDAYRTTHSVELMRGYWIYSPVKSSLPVD